MRFWSPVSAPANLYSGNNDELIRTNDLLYPLDFQRRADDAIDAGRDSVLRTEVNQVFDLMSMSIGIDIRLRHTREDGDGKDPEFGSGTCFHRRPHHLTLCMHCQKTRTSLATCTVARRTCS